MLPLLYADRFLVIQGAETGMPSQLFTGNIPIFADVHILRGLCLGLFLFIAAWVASRIIRLRATKNRLTQPKARWYQVAVFLTFFIVWDLALRLPALGPNRQFIPDPRTFWSANPSVLKDAIDVGGAGIVGINRTPVESIFDQDHTGPKPKDTWRILFMGDSQAISCHPDSYSRFSYPKTLERSIAQKNLRGPHGEKVEIIDAGMSGFTSHQGLILLRSDLLPLEPDVVVEAFGYHDANDAISPDSEVITDNPFVFRARQVMYSSNVCLLLRTAIMRTQEAKVERTRQDNLVTRVPLPQYRYNLEQFVNLGKQHHFQSVFFVEPTDESTFEKERDEYEQATQQVAAAHHVPVINTRQYFIALPGISGLFADSVHLTRQGHRVVADYVEEELLAHKLLVRRPRKGILPYKPE